MHKDKVWGTGAPPQDEEEEEERNIPNLSRHPICAVSSHKAEQHSGHCSGQVPCLPRTGFPVPPQDPAAAGGRGAGHSKRATRSPHRHHAGLGEKPALPLLVTQPDGDLQLFSQSIGVNIWQYLMKLQIINDFHATFTVKGHFPQLFIFQQRRVQPFSEIPRA